MLIYRMFNKGQEKIQSEEIALEKMVTFPKVLNWIFDLFMRIDEALIGLGVTLPFGGTLLVVAKKR